MISAWRIFGITWLVIKLMRNDMTEKRNIGPRRKRVSQIKIKIARKLYFFMMVFLVMLLYTGIYKIYDIKYVSGKNENYETKAIYNQVNKIQDKIINPNRGAIFDRNRQSLAVSLTVYNVVLDIRTYNELDDDKKKQDILEALNKTIGISMDELNDYVKKDESGNLVNDTNYKIIKKEVEYNVGQELKNLNLNCVYLEEDTKRIYPNNSLASQVVGFIRGDSSWGLESYYNEVMTGTPGRIFRTYEENNSIVTRQEPAQEGYSLITTIDQTIQQFAEKAVKTAYYEYNAENTAAIVMNPNTGEILAMTSYPTFDLNSPDKISLLEDESYKNAWKQMKDEEKSADMLKSWKNFNITDTFEPGSIFKPIVVAAALEEGAIKETDSFYCGGVKIFGENEDDKIWCHKKSGHGMQTLEQVLANSCNCGLVDIGLKLGADKFYKYQKDFGYGEKTGVDLVGEATAKSLLYSLDMLKESDIYIGSSSIGQGFNATSMQSMNAFAATINGGNVMKPYIVSQIIDKDGNIIEEHNPKVVRKVISQSTSDYIRNALESVVTETGTGKKARIDGYAIGGKTGTGQQGDRKKNINTCSFIAYLPVDNPEIMVGVFMHKPIPYIEGTTSPAPMLKEIMLNIIDYKAIPPDYESDSNNKVAVKNSEILVEDYVNKNLSKVINELNTKNIRYEIVGNGDLIYKQSPSANNKIDKSSEIILFAKQSDTSKELVLVPNVEGMTSEQAKKLIESNGFLCDIVQKEDSENVIEETTVQNSKSTVSSAKTIIEQYPNPEVKIEKGTVIRLIEG